MRGNTSIGNIHQQSTGYKFMVNPTGSTLSDSDRPHALLKGAHQL